MGLMDLPAELLELIALSLRRPALLEWVNWPNGFIFDLMGCSDLSALSRSCKRLHRTITPILYQIPCVDSDEAAAKLRRTLCVRPELTQYPRTVSIEYRQSCEDEMRVRFLGDLPNLEHLHVQGNEFDIDAYEEDKDAHWFTLWKEAIKPPLPGEVAPLSSLRSCTICLANDDGNNKSVDEVWEVFLHPTLERITMDYSRAHHSLEEEFSSTGRPYLQSTLLEELHFVESEIFPDGLHSILQCPKSLKALSICNGTQVGCEERYDPISMERYLYSMRGLASTLEYFRFHDCYNLVDGLAIGLASFSALKVLDIDITLLRVSQPFNDMAKVMPPNLEILRFQDVWKRSASHDEFLSNLANRRSSLVPKLRMLKFSCEHEAAAEGAESKGWYKAFQDGGVEIEFEESCRCPMRQCSCTNRYSGAVLLRWRNSR